MNLKKNDWSNFRYGAMHRRICTKCFSTCSIACQSNRKRPRTTPSTCASSTWSRGCYRRCRTDLCSVQLLANRYGTSWALYSITILALSTYFCNFLTLTPERESFRSAVFCILFHLNQKLQFSNYNMIHGH